MTAHSDRKISLLTQTPQYFFPNFPRQNPYFSQSFSFSSLKISDDLLLAITNKNACFPNTTPSSCIHHCKSSLSSLHIFVHHCTFCASLHVKTCPVRLKEIT